MRKTLVLIFVLINALAVTVINRPAWFKSSSDPVNRLVWMARVYAHWAGTDARWEMFSYMYRDDWQLIFKGRASDNPNESVLALPLQSQRSFWDRWLFDFKEAKIRLNMYGDKKLRQRYARYLCRQSKLNNAAPLKYVACDLESQPLAPRILALAMGQHALGFKKTTRFDEVACAP